MSSSTLAKYRVLPEARGFCRTRLSHEATLHLIDEVENYEQIWNPLYRFYNNNELTLGVWNTIITELFIYGYKDADCAITTWESLCAFYNMEPSSEHEYTEEDVEYRAKMKEFLPEDQQLTPRSMTDEDFYNLPVIKKQFYQQFTQPAHNVAQPPVPMQPALLDPADMYPAMLGYKSAGSGIKYSPYEPFVKGQLPDFGGLSMNQNQPQPRLGMPYTNQASAPLRPFGTQMPTNWNQSRRPGAYPWSSYAASSNATAFYQSGYPPAAPAPVTQNPSPARLDTMDRLQTTKQTEQDKKTMKQKLAPLKAQYKTLKQRIENFYTEISNFADVSTFENKYEAGEFLAACTSFETQVDELHDHCRGVFSMAKCGVELIEVVEEDMLKMIEKADELESRLPYLSKDNEEEGKDDKDDVARIVPTEVAKTDTITSTKPVTPNEKEAVTENLNIPAPVMKQHSKQQTVRSTSNVAQPPVPMQRAPYPYAPYDGYSCIAGRSPASAYEPMRASSAMGQQPGYVMSYTNQAQAQSRQFSTQRMSQTAPTYRHPLAPAYPPTFNQSGYYGQTPAAPAQNPVQGYTAPAYPPTFNQSGYYGQTPAAPAQNPVQGYTAPAYPPTFNQSGYYGQTPAAPAQNPVQGYAAPAYPPTFNQSYYGQTPAAPAQNPAPAYAAQAAPASNQPGYRAQAPAAQAQNPAPAYAAPAAPASNQPGYRAQAPAAQAQNPAPAYAAPAYPPTFNQSGYYGPTPAAPAQNPAPAYAASAHNSAPVYAAPAAPASNQPGYRAQAPAAQAQNPVQGYAAPAYPPNFNQSRYYGPNPAAPAQNPLPAYAVPAAPASNQHGYRAQAPAAPAHNSAPVYAAPVAQNPALVQNDTTAPVQTAKQPGQDEKTVEENLAFLDGTNAVRLRNNSLTNEMGKCADVTTFDDQMYTEDKDDVAGFVPTAEVVKKNTATITKPVIQNENEGVADNSNIAESIQAIEVAAVSPNPEQAASQPLAEKGATTTPSLAAEEATATQPLAAGDSTATEAHAAAPEQVMEAIRPEPIIQDAEVTARRVVLDEPAVVEQAHEVIQNAPVRRAELSNTDHFIIHIISVIISLFLYQYFAM